MALGLNRPCDTAPWTIPLFSGRLIYSSVLMPKKLTITVDGAIYEGLHTAIGPRRISRFFNDLAWPHVVRLGLAVEYAAMAADEAREAEAAQWENLALDVADEPRR